MIGRTLWKALFAFCVATAVLPISSLANEQCQYLRQQEVDQWEWLDGEDKPHGLRLSVRDDRWKLLSTMHGLVIECRNCPDDKIDHVKLDIGVPFSKAPQSHWPPADLDFQGLSNLQIVMHPKMVGWMLRAKTQGDLVELRSVSDIESASFAGLNGHARVLASEWDGRRHYAVAFYAAEKCFSVYGLFFSAAGKEISIADLAGPAVAFERYVAVVTPDKLLQAAPPPTTEPLPLGDARKRAREGRQ